MTSDHASARRCSASQFRNESISRVTKETVKGSTWIGTWFFLFFFFLNYHSILLYNFMIFIEEMIFFFLFMLKKLRKSY